jgi:hypothetical protein
LHENSRDEDAVLVIAGGGVLTFKGVLTVCRTIALEPPGLVLWDLSAAALTSLNVDVLRSLAEAVREFPPTESRVAIVCPRDVDFGIARELTLLMSFEHYPASAAVFRDRPAAMRWLRQSE